MGHAWEDKGIPLGGGKDIDPAPTLGPPLITSVPKLELGLYRVRNRGKGSRETGGPVRSPVLSHPT